MLSSQVASYQRERISLRSPDWRWSWAHGCAAPFVSPAGPETVGGKESESIHVVLLLLHECINEEARTPRRTHAHIHISFCKFLSVNIQHPLPVASLLSFILFDIFPSSDSVFVSFDLHAGWDSQHTPSLTLSDFSDLSGCDSFLKACCWAASEEGLDTSSIIFSYTL